MTTILGDKVVVDPGTGNGTTFNDPLAKPATALHWNVDTFDGWNKSSGRQNTIAPRGGYQDGAIVGDSYAKERYYLISGYATAATRAELDALKDAIVLAFPENRDVIVERHEPVPKKVTVRLYDGYEFVNTGPLAMRWAVPVVAGDPLKYSVSASVATAGAAGQSTGGRTYPRTYPMVYTSSGNGEANAAVVTNFGPSDTWATITIHGPLTQGAWRITNETTGEDLRFDVDVLASDELLIDFRNNVAYLNGYPVTSTIVGDFWKVVPGVNVIKLFADYDVAVSFTVTVYSAWK